MTHATKAIEKNSKTLVQVYNRSMSSISLIILPIYQKYAPRLSKIGGIIDLSIKDPSISVKSPRTPEAFITDFFNYVLKNTKKPHLLISSTDKYLIIKEENTLLDENLKMRFSQYKDLKISSRIGFGTKLQFPLL